MRKITEITISKTEDTLFENIFPGYSSGSIIQETFPKC